MSLFRMKQSTNWNGKFLPAFSEQNSKNLKLSKEDLARWEKNQLIEFIDIGEEKINPTKDKESNESNPKNEEGQTGETKNKKVSDPKKN